MGIKQNYLNLLGFFGCCSMEKKRDNIKKKILCILAVGRFFNIRNKIYTFISQERMLFKSIDPLTAGRVTVNFN